MTGGRAKLILTFFSLISPSLAYFSYDYKFMNTECRSANPSFEVDVAIKLYGGSSISGYPAGECILVLEADNYDKKLILKFKKLNLALGDTIEIYDGKSKFDEKLTDSPLSGTDDDFDKGYRSSGKYMAVVLNSISGSTYRDAFDAIVTEYETDYCFSYDYKCCNGDCIDGDLRNDWEDNCVDDSDEWDVSGCLTAGALAGVIIGVIVGGIILITICAVCIYRQQKKARINRQRMPAPAPRTYPSQAPVQYAVQTQQVSAGVYVPPPQQAGMSGYPAQRYYTGPPQPGYNPAGYPPPPQPAPAQPAPQNPPPAVDQQGTSPPSYADAVEPSRPEQK